MTVLRIGNWNVEGNRQTKYRTPLIQRTLADLEADILCVTEGFVKNLPEQDNENVITSGLSGWGKPEEKGGRKVILWSKFGWFDVDEVGSPRLPEGRYVAASTKTPAGTIVHVIGVCIPYHDYRNGPQWGDKQKRRWQGNAEYLTVLREDVLSQPRFREKTIIMGDFNLQIPPQNYPPPNSEINEERRLTFAGYHIATTEDNITFSIDQPHKLNKMFPYEKPGVIHVAHTRDIKAEFVWRFSRFMPDGRELSDHHGVFMTVHV